jgi:hypothetical protein
MTNGTLIRRVGIIPSFPSGTFAQRKGRDCATHQAKTVNDTFVDNLIIPTGGRRRQGTARAVNNDD